jgi:hypothetical protein
LLLLLIEISGLLIEKRPMYCGKVAVFGGAVALIIENLSFLEDSRVSTEMLIIDLSAELSPRESRVRRIHMAVTVSSVLRGLAPFQVPIAIQVHSMDDFRSSCLHSRCIIAMGRSNSNT